MKSTLKVHLGFLIALFILAIACEEEEEELNVWAEKFTKTVSENQQKCALIGILEATSTRGAITYSLTNVTPSGAISIDLNNGEISVADSSLFDFELNPTISAFANARVENQTVIVTVTINLTDVDETTLSAADFAVTINENPLNGDTLGIIPATADTSSTIAPNFNTVLIMFELFI